MDQLILASISHAHNLVNIACHRFKSLIPKNYNKNDDDSYKDMTRELGGEMPSDAPYTVV